MVHIPTQQSALLLIDVINNFQFKDGDSLFQQALPIGNKIAILKKQCKSYNIPVIYVNDNFKNWNIEFHELVQSCLDNSLSKTFVEKIKPEKDDFYILKPSYSGFYATPLHILLEQYNVKNLIFTGIAGNMCVQWTANDAFMHEYKLYSPSDCIASNDQYSNDIALWQMEKILKANITPSSQYCFG